MKKLLAILVSITLILGVAVYAEEPQSITAYITVSRYGEFINSAENTPTVNLPIQLTENATLDDAFKTAHNLYFDGGSASGYASDTGEWGAYVTKFWGDESGRFGYQINSGTKSVAGLSHIIEDGDFIEACIYKNSYPYTESYATFNRVTAEVFINEDVEITLNSVSGYDEEYNMVFSPCENAVITINGQVTEKMTDAEGKVTLAFGEEGSYIVSAQKTKELNEEIVPAICAPVCVVEVRTPDYIKAIHGIAEKYSQNGVLNDANMLWLIADMEVYSQVYPESNNILTNKQAYLDKVIEFASTATTPGDISKAIIAMRALGYDAKNVYTKDSVKIDVVNKLTTLIDEGNTDVINPYTLPYVIIALKQGDYATDTRTEYLLNAAISTKADWQNLEYGPDAAAPMLLALASYSETNADIEAAIDETLPLIAECQTESGLMNSWGAAASTGLSIAAYSALRIDADTIINNENSLIDGLMTMCTEEFDAFEPLENTFSTEQAFRGLLAYQLFKTDNAKILYDFSDYSMTEARATVPVSTPVFSGGGVSSIPKEEPKEETEKESEDAEEPKEDVEEALEFSEDTFDDVAAEDWYYKSVEYVYKNNLMQGTEIGFEPESKMTRAMLACVIYRMENPEEALDRNIFIDIKSGEWYTDAVVWASSNGIVNGITKNEFAPDENITREQMAAIMFRYAKFKNMDVSAYADIESFADVDEVSEYAASAFKWANGSGIINGETESLLNPKGDATRAQVATILMRFCEVNK